MTSDPTSDPVVDWAPRESACRVGIATGDITPPIGVRAHNWGAARESVAIGVHHPLSAGVIAINSSDGLRYIITVDLGWWQNVAAFDRVMSPLVERLRVDRDRVLLHLTHTHSGPSICDTDHRLPGVGLLDDYREQLVETLGRLAHAAASDAFDATITWAYGSCHLAVVRDVPCGERYAVGFNPDADADTTVLVGRVVDADGGDRAILVNYACHPTTLGWDNRLLSPDFLGEMRREVETRTGVPCLFFQGASGELSPREQYTADTSVADRHGRTLAYAVLSTLSNMGRAGVGLHFDGVVESGAPLAIWSETPRTPDEQQSFVRLDVEFECRPPLTEAALLSQWKDLDPAAARERMTRANRLADGYRDAHGRAFHPLHLWRLGDAVVVAHPGEAYSDLQRELRRRHPDLAIAVLNLTNGPGFMYLPPRAAYDDDRYQVWQTLAAAGSLERLIDAADGHLRSIARAPLAAVTQ